MERTTTQERYTYWRKPWGKWICLAAGGLNLISLWRDAADYQEFSSLGIFDAETMEEIQFSLKMSISTSAVLAVLFFGCVIIGCAARSEKTARRAEGGLFFLMAAAYGVAGSVHGLFSMPGWSGRFTLILLLLLLAAGSYSLWQGRK